MAGRLANGTVTYPAGRLCSFLFALAISFGRSDLALVPPSEPNKRALSEFLLCFPLALSPPGRPLPSLGAQANCLATLSFVHSPSGLFPPNHLHQLANLSIEPRAPLSLSLYLLFWTESKLGQLDKAIRIPRASCFIWPSRRQTRLQLANRRRQHLLAQTC